MERNIYKIGKELFITSNEEIKEKSKLNTKDYYYIKNHYNEWYVGKFNGKFFDFINNQGNFSSILFTCKKIILTTDQHLIADGVQAIDDEFLQWFVKNPSCEWVKVEAKWFTYMEYKIIIPKEKPYKTHYLDELPNMDREVLAKMWESAMPKLESKQETPEEVAHKMLDDYGIKSMGQSIGVLEVKKLMVKMAKWQQQGYSEEEAKLKEALLEMRKTPMTFVPDEKMYNKKETPEEVAKRYAKELYENKFGAEAIIMIDNAETDFIAGAKSDAARDYWFEIFKKKKYEM